MRYKQNLLVRYRLFFLGTHFKSTLLRRLHTTFAYSWLLKDHVGKLIMRYVSDHIYTFGCSFRDSIRNVEDAGCFSRRPLTCNLSCWPETLDIWIKRTRRYQLYLWQLAMEGIASISRCLLFLSGFSALWSPDAPVYVNLTKLIRR